MTNSNAEVRGIYNNKLHMKKKQVGNSNGKRTYVCT